MFNKMRLNFGEIDINTTASGLRFEKAYGRSLPVDIEGIKVYILSIDDMILNKRTSGRTKDLADVEVLEFMKNSEQNDRADA